MTPLYRNARHNARKYPRPGGMGPEDRINRRERSAADETE
ncbi:hypothetical protein CLOSTASPAR_04466 [[Clostridium] asparagiforme DSM 15981]|uniref:Uncharacterized protein n=1 Tax=[Clostridium] asparagiforme DSM 15981 TaxID=518636 RepID=C0D5C0_9FIRM|nr:hypothetical protein CLOSTASPAR_04466 [[Clostridium] asparagiforme DSM 15981]